MANNRLWVVCTICEQEEKPFEVYKFFMAKYYPSQGWYLNRDANRQSSFGPELEAWFDLHKHRSMFGTEWLEFRYESPLSV